MDLNKLKLHVEDVQEALDEGEIDLGTGTSVREVLDALDHLLVREAELNSLVAELRQNVWEQSANYAAAKRRADELEARAQRDDRFLESSNAELLAKVENQARTINAIIAQRDFHASQLTAIAIALKARQ